MQVNVRSPLGPTAMDREIADLQNRHREGVPFNNPLIQELTELKNRYVAHKELLEKELQQQIDSIELIWDNLSLNIENMKFIPEVTSQLENLKNMAQTLLNQQQEKQQALDVALERLKIEKNDSHELESRQMRMQRKLDSMPKNPYGKAVKSFVQRGNYQIIFGHEPPSDYREDTF